MALTKKLTDIAEAIRNKTGKSDLLTLEQMPTEIAAIETGGGELPEEAYKITGNCRQRFCNNGWNWYIDAFGNKVTTENINDCYQMFLSSNELTKIPFDINIVKSCYNMSGFFQQNQKLETAPLIKGELNLPTSNYNGTVNMENFFYHCEYLREIPEDYFHNFGGDAYWTKHKEYQGGRGNLFAYCYSLRKLPDISILEIKSSSTYYSLYYYTFPSCYALDEITALPVEKGSTYSSNAFSNTFSSCDRLKNMMFETQADGTPYSVSWKNQTIDLSSGYGIGAASSVSHITSYNSGITRDTQVWDDASYAALKDDPDWWTTDWKYSRYNHDSAVNTINSLPSTSGTGCSIKFYGEAGSATDGGAINTLTEEEIAVAAAKGWTVTLV